MDIRDFKNKLLREDIGDFQIGKTTTSDSAKTTITDIDPETQSVTWTVNKDLTDDDIHRDLSKLIDKLESNQKRYHDQKRIKQLLQKLKFIRNTFKRTSIEEIKIEKPILSKKINLYKEKAIEEFENYREEIGNDIDVFEEYIEQIENNNDINIIDKALLWLYSGSQEYVDELKQEIFN